MHQLRIKMRERDAIVAYLGERPRTSYARVAKAFSRHPKTIAALARANGLARRSK